MAISCPYTQYKCRQRRRGNWKWSFSIKTAAFKELLKGGGEENLGRTFASFNGGITCGFNSLSLSLFLGSLENYQLPRFSFQKFATLHEEKWPTDHAQEPNSLNVWKVWNQWGFNKVLKFRVHLTLTQAKQLYIETPTQGYWILLLTVIILAVFTLLKIR